MKYVILDANGHKLPVIFPEALNHDIVAASIAAAIKLQVPSSLPVIWGAGFVNPDVKSVWGRSETLNVESKPTDLPYLAHGAAIAHMPPVEALAFYNHVESMRPSK